MKTLYINVVVGVLICAVSTDVVTACPINCTCSRETNGQHVECTHNAVTRIPKDFPVDSSSIHIHFNNISTIEEGAYQNLFFLRQISLQICSITTIEPGAFVNLPNLETLYLMNNGIVTIQEGIFKDIPELKYLYFDSNRITTIGQNVFNHLSRLNILNLSYNKLTFIKYDMFGNLPYLTSLLLIDNQIVTIQQGPFQRLPALLHVDLSGNNLLFVKDDTFEYNIYLRTLNIELVCDCNVLFWFWLKSKSVPKEGITCLDHNNVQLSSLKASDFDTCTYPTTQLTDTQQESTITGVRPESTYSTIHLTDAQQESTTTGITPEITYSTNDLNDTQKESSTTVATETPTYTALFGSVAGIAGLIIIIAAVIFVLQRKSMLENCQLQAVSKQRESAVYENEIRLHNKVYQDLTLVRAGNHSPYDVVHNTNA